MPICQGEEKGDEGGERREEGDGEEERVKKVREGGDHGARGEVEGEGGDKKDEEVKR